MILSDGEDGPALAEVLRQRVERATYPPLGHLDAPVQVTISFGVARTGETGTSIRAAEDALHEAKRQGRNRVVVAPS